MIRFLIFLLILPLATVFADTIKLKSGEILQGHVVSSDATSITVDVQFSPTIVDQQTYARTDVAAISIEAGDEIAYAKIKDIKTPETALVPRTCQVLIDDQLAPFLKQYPNSARAGDVRRQINDLQTDLARLRGGDVKVFGVWYDKASFEAEKYQIQAATVLEAMKEQIAGGNFPAAMNSFDLLQHTYPNSLAYVAAVPLAQKALESLEEQLNLAMSSLPQTKAQRQASIDRTPIEQQAPVRNAIAADDARAAATAAMAQKNNQRFFTIFPFDEQGIKAMLVSAQQEGVTLAAIDLKKLNTGAQLVRQANQELATHQLAAVDTTLAELKVAWSDYEGTLRMQQQLQADKTADQASLARDKAPGAPH